MKSREDPNMDEYKVIETYYGKDGRVLRQTKMKSKESEEAVMKVPVKITVKTDSVAKLMDVIENVEKIRNGQPLAEVHFLIDLT